MVFDLTEIYAPSAHPQLEDAERLTYVVRSRSGTHAGFKLGATHRPESRIKQINREVSRDCTRLECPSVRDLQFVRVYRLGFAFESFLHYYFGDRKIHGEWYDVSVESLDSIAASFEPVYAAIHILVVAHDLRFEPRDGRRSSFRVQNGAGH